MARPRHRPMLRGLRVLVAQSAIVVIACVMLLGTLRAGARYYVCPAMNALLPAPCCEHHSNDDDGDAASLEDGDCCRAKQLGSMPISTVPSVAGVAAAPCSAVLPARIDACRSRFDATTARFRQPAGAGPPSANERRSSLMIWLI